jgi:TetR/AcrR family fatty acid metabolism transcriptional regulator
LTRSIQSCYNLTMRIKDKPDGQNQPTFIEAARRTQIIECAIETLATLGYAQASLAQIAKRAGISKGVIVYYFSSKEELFEQVMKAIYMAGANFMRPQIAAQPTATLMLRTYIQTNVEYIRTHPMEMMAAREIALNFRREDGKLRFGLATEEPALKALEALLRKGQHDGEFRAFDPRVMALTIRRVIDTLPHVLMANPDLDGEAYGQELVTLFDRATALTISPSQQTSGSA